MASERCEGRRGRVTVEIRRAASGALVRTVRTHDGRFHVRLRPGRYRLSATAGAGSASTSVRVRRHRFTVVVLRLHNVHVAGAQ